MSTLILILVIGSIFILVEDSHDAVEDAMEDSIGVIGLDADDIII